MSRENKGFTLIELLVVIAIIGVLASTVLASLNTARTKARDARRIADLHQIGLALEFYIDQNNTYPGDPTTYFWISDNNYPGAGPWPPCSTTTGGLKSWLASVCTFNDPLGYPYAYTFIDSTHYRVGARFELTDHRGAAFLSGNGSIIANYFEPK